jgi:hypothetical protein
MGIALLIVPASRSIPQRALDRLGLEQLSPEQPVTCTSFLPNLSSFGLHHRHLFLLSLAGSPVDHCTLQFFDLMVQRDANAVQAFSGIKYLKHPLRFFDGELQIGGDRIGELGGIFFHAHIRDAIEQDFKTLTAQPGNGFPPA